MTIGAPHPSELAAHELRARIAAQQELVRIVRRNLAGLLTGPVVMDLVARAIMSAALDDLDLMLGSTCSICGCTRGLPCVRPYCTLQRDGRCTRCAAVPELVVVLDVDTDHDADVGTNCDFDIEADDG